MEPVSEITVVFLSALLLFDYLAAKCFSNQATIAADALLASSPRKPCPAPFITISSLVTFCFSNSAMILVLLVKGTNVSRSPWINNVGGSSDDTYMIGEMLAATVSSRSSAENRSTARGTARPLP